MQAACSPDETALFTALIARHELQAAFVRREGERALKSGEADRLYALDDIARGDIREIPSGAELQAEYAKVLSECLFCSPPLLIRTNDVLHLGSTRLAGELEFVLADFSPRGCAAHLGFKVPT